MNESFMLGLKLSLYMYVSEWNKFVLTDGETHVKYKDQWESVLKDFIIIHYLGHVIDLLIVWSIDWLIVN